MAKVDGSSTLLFDEIDTGVSGGVSGAMADLLRTPSRHRQVFCVTHQPLVAAVADHHFRVSKDVSAGITRSRGVHLPVTLRSASGNWQNWLAAISKKLRPMRPAFSIVCVA